MSFAALLAALWGATCASAEARELHGWQAMRVIHQEGFPIRAAVADFGEGHEQVIVVNTRQARLELYRWLAPDERPKEVKLDPERPNELPMAPEWERTEIGFDKLPADVVVADVKGDKKPELLVLTVDTHEILVYGQDSDGKWKQVDHYDLPPGEPASHRHVLLLRKLPTGKRELLVSTDAGIQILPLDNEERAGWLTPRESKGRRDWKLVDLDGDGDDDLIEWSDVARQTVRWYECSDTGALLPAKVLHDQSIEGLEVIARAGQPADLLLLGGTHSGLLRRYRLARGESTEIGRQDSLPMPGASKALWCGIEIDGEKALVASDGSQPRIRVHQLGERGWLDEQSYPTLAGVKALAAPAAKPGTLLLWVKDAPDLHQSHWKSGRMTYPASWAQSEDTSDRRILTLESVGDITWWAQRVGSDVDVYIWRPKDKEPEKLHFDDLGAKTEKVVWLGGERILFQQAYSTAAQLATLKDDKTKITKLPHLDKADLSQFGLYEVGDELRAGRSVDGVLQWLDENLEPNDQTMLPDGQRLAGFAPLDKGQAWGLDQSAQRLHKLKTDKSGIARVVDSYKPPTSGGLRLDPVLGLLVNDTERVVRLSEGRPWELQLVETLDSRVGRPSGVREATIHRFALADLLDDETNEVVLFDDRRHQITVLEPTAKELKPLMSWQVFEDQAYPYGGEHESFASEPRVMLGFNADGDSNRDAVLLCHDRLLIYLGREESE